MEVNVIRGDIAKQEADALVNAAGTSLMMETNGTGSVLLDGGGPQLGEAAIENGPIELGEVAVTDGYDLDAEYVIHAATAHYGGNAKPEYIREGARRVLHTADRLECSTLCMPAIGCGRAGFDISKGGQIILRTIDDSETTTLEKLTLIGYTDDEYDVLQELASEILS